MLTSGFTTTFAVRDAVSGPACSAPWSRNSPAAPDKAIKYGSGVSNNRSRLSCRSALVAALITAALSANKTAAAAPRAVARHHRGPVRPAAARTRAPTSVTLPTTAQAVPSGCPLPTAGLAAAQNPASPITMAAMPSTSRHPTRRRNPTTKMATRNTSSVVSTGCTTLSCPKCSAVAWNPNVQSISRNPISQPRLRTACRISRGLRSLDVGADSSATRWNTTASAEQNAAQAASAMATAIDPRPFVTVVPYSNLPSAVSKVNVVNLELVQHYGLMATTVSGRGQHRSQQRSSYHHGDLPNALTDAATEMARAGGPDAVVLRAAARATGVSAAAAYRHFADHGELLHAVRLRALDALADAMRASLDADEPIADPAQEAIRRLRALGRAYIGFAMNDPGLFRTAFSCRPDNDHDHGHPLPESTKDIADDGPFVIVSGVLDELVQTGVLAAHRRQGAEIAAWAAVHGLATLLLDGPLARLAAEERANAIAKTSEFILAGLTAREIQV